MPYYELVGLHVAGSRRSLFKRIVIRVRLVYAILGQTVNRDDGDRDPIRLSRVGRRANLPCGDAPSRRRGHARLACGRA